MIQWSQLDESATVLKERVGNRRFAGALVLGSGFKFEESGLEVVTSVGYDELAALGTPTVAGHRGRAYVVQRNGAALLIFSGRRHLYELDGPDVTPVVAPAYLAREVGARSLILTNASGGITREPGDFVVVADHMNYTGVSPLRGPNNDRWGCRFPALGEAYAEPLRGVLADALKAAGARPSTGKYIQVMGPNYETPTEVDIFRQWGMDLVGMSTAVEVIFANAGGLAVGCVSLVTNKACGVGDKPIEHEHVITAGLAAQPIFAAFVPALIDRLAT